MKMDNEQAAKRRIFCVDLLRVLDIFYLLVIHYAFLAPAVFKAWPLKSTASFVFLTLGLALVLLAAAVRRRGAHGDPDRLGLDVEPVPLQCP